MSYEGTDLGYERGYETEVPSRTRRSVAKLSSDHQSTISYSMAGTPGGVTALPGLKVTPGFGVDGDVKPKDEDKKDEGPKINPKAKAELGNLEKKKDIPFFFESSKLKEPASDPKTSQDRQHLKKVGIEDPDVQKVYLDLVESPSEKDVEKGKTAFKDKDPIALQKEAGQALAFKTYKALKTKGYSDEAIKDYMISQGMIEGANLPPSGKESFYLPMKDDGNGGSVPDLDKLGPYDIVRHYHNLDKIDEGAPHHPAKGTKQKEENNTWLKNQSKFITAREKWISHVTQSKDEGGLGWSRADAEKRLGHMGLMGTIKDPEAAAAKLFKAKDGESVLVTRNDGTTDITTVNGEPRVPQGDVTPAEYKKMSAADRAKFDEEHPVEAGDIKARTHSQLQSHYQKALTDKIPDGLGIHPHEANGILASKFSGDPPLFKTDGTLKTAEEMGLDQDAYEARLKQFDDKIVAARKEVLGKAFVLDKNGNPETITKKNDDGTTTTIYKFVSEDPADQQKDLDRLMSARNDWRDERNQEAREYHRERAVEQMRKIGVDEKNMEMLLHGRRLLSDEADPTEIAKFADELEAVDPKDYKAKKTELLKEVKDKGYNAPEDNAPEGQNFAKFKTGKDDKKAGGGGTSKDKEAQRARDHQTSERKAGEAFQLKRDKAQEAFQMKMKEYDKQTQIELQKLQLKNQKEMADYQEQIDNRKAVRDFRLQGVSVGLQNLWQDMGGLTMKSMESAFGQSQILAQGAQQMNANSQPRPFEIVLAMSGGRGHGRP